MNQGIISEAGMRRDVWTFGGGVQSIAMLVLIIQGKLAKPERIVMADTSRERQAVWDYLDEIAKPAMMRHGMTLEVIPHSYSTVDIMAQNGDLLIPVFFKNAARGKRGKLPAFCSNKWKQRPVRRYLRKLGYGPDKPVRMWFGMSLDEVGRMRQADVKWIENYYPLCQDSAIKLRRHECLSLIERHGWPQPPSSACWMCPNRDNKTWQEMKDNEPEDFEKAVKFERVITGAGWGDVYLHGDVKPLDEIDFDKPAQPSLFDECAFNCWT
jgi:hypothetical protein